MAWKPANDTVCRDSANHTAQNVPYKRKMVVYIEQESGLAPLSILLYSARLTIHVLLTLSHFSSDIAKTPDGGIRQ